MRDGLTLRCQSGRGDASAGGGVYIGGMRIIGPAIIALFLSAGTAAADCVVLLHGLARGEGSLLAIEEALEAQDYHVVNQGYPSRQASIRPLAAAALLEPS